MVINLVNCISLDSCLIKIKLYDSANNLIGLYKDRKKQAVFDIDYGVYKMYIYKNNELIDIIIVLYNEKNKSFSYKYNDYNLLKNVKFIVYDSHYFGLKIERGDLLLKNIM